MLTIGRQVRVIRRNQRFTEHTRRRQSRRSQHHRVNQVDYIWLKLIETPQEEWAKKVKSQFRIKGQWHARCAYNLRSRVLSHATFRTQQQRSVPLTL